jgi:hypothetical protein
MSFEPKRASEDISHPTPSQQIETRFTGKHFRLKAATLGIETVGNHTEAVHVPAGDVVIALSGPRNDDARMISVRWNNKTLVMFVEDIETRGLEVDGSPSAGAV